MTTTLNQLKQALAEQAEATSRFKLLGLKKEELEQTIAQSATLVEEYERDRKLLLGSLAANVITEQQHGVKRKKLDGQIAAHEEQVDLLEAVKLRLDFENENISAGTGTIQRLREAARSEIYDSVMERLRKQKGVVSALRELAGLCDLCGRHEESAFEELRGPITSEERQEITDRLSESGLLHG